MNPATLNLNSKGQAVTVYVLGPNLALFLPIGPLDLNLVIPGGPSVPIDASFAGSATIGTLNGQPALTLKFDRASVEASIRAGIRDNAINPALPVALTLASGSSLLDSASIVVKP